MRARRISPSDLGLLAPDELAGAVLLGGIRLPDRSLAKGTRLGPADGLGGQVLRRGVPAHPGSMIWLGRLGDSRLLGLPSCGMFALATAADLVLPRLLTGERLEAGDLADMGHGGILTREMRFRFPDYARELEAPEG